MSSGYGWKNGLQCGGQLRIYSVNSHGQLTKYGSPAWGLGEVVTTPHHKNWPFYKKDACVSGLE